MIFCYLKYKCGFIVEQNMGCGQVIGPCAQIPDCSNSCKMMFGPYANGFCDRDAGTGQCLCGYPCPNKTHIWFMYNYEILNFSKL